MLKIGSKGDLVKQLQIKLGIVADGDFGLTTEKYLKDWQTKNGLIPDGVAGPTTLAKMGIKEAIVENKTTIVSDFKLNNLKGIIPDSVINQIPDTAKKFNITNVLRLSHFLSQCAHESGNFKAVEENLNYSSEGLKKTFGKYFPGNLSESYAKQPEKIGSRVYSGRMGNGDESSKEGYKFRGRGFIQLTGKDNYKKFGEFLKEDFITNPESVATKYPLSSAAFFFDTNKLWAICDKGSSEEVVKELTKRVNGGFNGLDDRIQKFNKFYNLLK